MRACVWVRVLVLVMYVCVYVRVYACVHIPCICMRLCTHCTHLCVRLSMCVCVCVFLVGFDFSDVEPSALVQKQGGPCAVIAPVQAYLLKIIIMDMPGTQLTKVSICSVPLDPIPPYPIPTHLIPHQNTSRHIPHPQPASLSLSLSVAI